MLIAYTLFASKPGYLLILILLLIFIEYNLLVLDNKGIEYILYGDLDVNKWLKMKKYVYKKRETKKFRQLNLIVETSGYYYKGDFQKAITCSNDIKFNYLGRYKVEFQLLTCFTLFKANLMLKNFEEALRMQTLIQSINCGTKKNISKQKKILDFCDITIDICINKKINNSINTWIPIKTSRLLILEKNIFKY